MLSAWCLAALAAAPAATESRRPADAGSGAASCGNVPDVPWEALVARPPQPGPPGDGGLPQDLAPLVKILSTGKPPQSRYIWEVPAQVGAVDVQAVQVVNGLPVRFSAAVSAQDVPTLLEYYTRAFQKAGLFLPPAAEQVNLGERVFQLTGLDTDSLISYTVVLQPVAEKRTNVIMGQGYLTQWLERKAPGADIAPLPAGAESVVRTHSEGVELLQFTTGATAGELKGFYQDVLTRSGYAEAGGGVFTRGRESLKVSIGQARNAPGRAVMIERRLTAAPAEDDAL
ncbi:MAG: hypothetical protein ACYC8T_09905 [Myxococcaceae bacterium]